MPNDNFQTTEEQDTAPYEEAPAQPPLATSNFNNDVTVDGEDPLIIDDLAPRFLAEDYAVAKEKLKELYSGVKWTDSEVAAQKIANISDLLDRENHVKAEAKLPGGAYELSQSLLDTSLDDDAKVKKIESWRDGAKFSMYNSKNPDDFLNGTAKEELIDHFATELRRSVYGKDRNAVVDGIARGVEAAVAPIVGTADAIFSTDFKPKTNKFLQDYQNPERDNTLLASVESGVGTVGGFFASSVHPATALSYLGATLVDQSKSVYDAALAETKSPEAAKAALLNSAPGILLGTFADRFVGGSIGTLMKGQKGFLGAFTGAAAGALGTTVQTVNTGYALAKETGNPTYEPTLRKILTEAAAGAIVGGAAGGLHDISRSIDREIGIRKLENEIKTSVKNLDSTPNKVKNASETSFDSINKNVMDDFIQTPEENNRPTTVTEGDLGMEVPKDAEAENADVGDAILANEPVHTIPTPRDLTITPAPDGFTPNAFMRSIARVLGGEMNVVPGIKGALAFYQTGIDKAGKLINRIVADSRIFRDPDQANATVAHEIGHFVDYADSRLDPDEGRPPAGTKEESEWLAQEPVLHKLIRFNRELRKEFKAADIQEEGKRLSSAWRLGSEEVINSEYRNNPKEIQADIFSMLLNDPARVEVEFPKIWEAFHKGLKANPELRSFWKEYIDIGTNKLKLDRWIQERRELGRLREAEIMQTAAEQGIENAKIEEKGKTKKAIENLQTRIVNRFKVAKDIFTLQGKNTPERQLAAELYNELSAGIRTHNRMAIQIDAPFNRLKNDYISLGIDAVGKDPLATWKNYEFHNRVLNETTRSIENIKENPQLYRQIGEELKTTLGQLLKESGQPEGLNPYKDVDFSSLSGQELVDQLAKIGNPKFKDYRRDLLKRISQRQSRQDHEQVLNPEYVEKATKDLKQDVAHRQDLLSYAQNKLKNARSDASKERWAEIVKEREQYLSEAQTSLSGFTPDGSNENLPIKSRTTGNIYSKRLSPDLRKAADYWTAGFGIKNVFILTPEDLRQGTYRGVIDPADLRRMERWLDDPKPSGRATSNSKGQSFILTTDPGDSYKAHHILSHEIGHLLVDKEILIQRREGTPLSQRGREKLVDSLVQEYARYKTELGENVSDVAEGLQGPAGHLINSKKKISELGPKNTEYLIGERQGFNEFLANQVTEYALNPDKKPSTLADSFFKKIGDSFRALWERLRGKFKESPTLNKWLDEQFSSYDALDALNSVDRGYTESNVESDTSSSGKTSEQESAIYLNDSNQELSLAAASVLSDNTFNVRRYMANPDTDVRSSERAISLMKEQLGPEKFTKLKNISERFHDIVGNWLFKSLEESGKVSPELLDHLKLNKNNYITFNVLKYFEKDPVIPATIRKQYGTFNDIGDELSATLMKTKALMYASEYQIANNAAINLASLGGYNVELVNPQRKLIKGKFEWISSPESVFDLKEKLQSKDPDNSYLIKFSDGVPSLYKINSPEFAKMFSSDSFAKSPTISKVLGFLDAHSKYFLERELKTLFSIPFVFSQPIYDRVQEAIYARSFLPTIPVIGKHLSPELRAVEKIGEAESRAFMRGELTDITGKLVNSGDLQHGYAEDYGGYTDTSLKAENVVYETMGVKIPGEEDVRMSAKVNRKVNKALEEFGYGTLKPIKALKRKAIKDEVKTKVIGYLLAKKKGLSDAEAIMVAREYFGTPDPTGGGTNATSINKLFLFGRAHINGLRAIANQLKDDPRGFGIQYGLRKGIPRLLLSGSIMAPLIGALAGQESEDLYRKYLDKIPSFDKIGKSIIPLGFRDGNGKFVGFSVKASDIDANYKADYIRLPASREFVSLANLQEPAVKALEELIDTGQINVKHTLNHLMEGVGAAFGSQFSPAVLGARRTQQLLTGQNPTDYYRNKGILPKDIQEAGTMSQKFYEYMFWSLNSTVPGVFNLGHSSQQSSTESLSVWDEVARIPAAGPLVTRFSGSSNYGDFEHSNADQQAKVERDADIRIHMGDVSKGVYNDYVKAQSNIARMGKGWKDNVSPETAEKYTTLQNWHARVYRHAFNELRAAYENGDEEATKEASANLEEASKALADDLKRISGSP